MQRIEIMEAQQLEIDYSGMFQDRRLEKRGSKY
jgi:hypothetical protein